jgi:hypothetical protein
MHNFVLLLQARSHNQNQMKKIAGLFTDFKVLLALAVILAGLVTLQSIMKGPKNFIEGGKTYTHYNNYLIFKQSSAHLAQGKDLYQSFPAEHHDLYKYSPSFALLFTPVAMLPDAAGLLLWNLLNVILLLYAVWKLPGLADSHKALVLLICLSELVKTTQNSQSNALMAALMILSFVLLEREHYLGASLLMVLSVFIKLFSIAGFALFLLYPGRWRLLLYSLVWTAILFLLPALVTGFPQLMLQYESWGSLLSGDHSASYGISVMGLLFAWSGLDPGKSWVVLAGALLFCVPLFFYRRWSDPAYRMLALAAVLIWAILFNHKTESPTLIIAMTGVAIWFFTTARSPLSWILLIASLLLTSLSSTDLFPRRITETLIRPYVLQVLPLILVWFMILAEMMAGPFLIHKKNS